MSQNPAQNQKPFSFKYDGIVRFTLERSPWALVFNLRGISLSDDQIIAELDRKYLDEKVSVTDFNILLEKDGIYSLQLEHRHEFLPYPVILARLLTWHEGATGMRFTFMFLNKDNELTCLIDELKPKKENL